MRDSVLIVDDDVNVIVALQVLLGAAYALRVARNGADALRLAQADPPDLVLLDVEMPGLDGYEVCARLKEVPALAEVPVIFLSQHHDDAAELRGLAVGAVDFIAKPPRGPVVQARIATHVRMKRMADALRVAAWIDGLTGIANRRRWDDVLPRECLRALRNRRALAVLMIDVDHFKAYNDRHGHAAGDACLRDVAQALQRCVHRPADLVARYGGEEFVMLLPDTDLAGAQAMGERVLAEVSAVRRVHGASSASPWVSVSIGGSAFDARSPGWQRDGDAVRADLSARDALERLSSQADTALYEAKRQGRARCLCPWPTEVADA
ncbi:diguanylate cyclase domain-containing protein [Pseudaquabacterium rugosum]|uniref:diguanylate cyclase n=1 Tax=Pseudaquabacterium rugosum TaxID=2984194 RepID=A0ABU9B6T4_9BURK